MGLIIDALERTFENLDFVYNMIHAQCNRPFQIELPFAFPVRI